MVTGYKRPLEEKDLWSLNQENCSKRVVSQLVAHWNRESQNIKRSGLFVFCKTEIRKHFTNAETAVKRQGVILMVCGWYAASESDDGAMNSVEDSICNALPTSNLLAMFVIKVRDVIKCISLHLDLYIIYIFYTLLVKYGEKVIVKKHALSNSHSQNAKAYLL